MSQSDLEEDFEHQLTRFRIVGWVREYVFATDMRRRWRFDFAWPDLKLAVEIDGIVITQIEKRRYVTGGHGTPHGLRDDADKGNAAILLGWSVLHFHQSHLKNNDAISMTQRALAAKGVKP